MTFNDGIVNNNYMETQKNQQQINDPLLINQLSPGLHLIEKHHIDGSKLKL